LRRLRRKTQSVTASTWVRGILLGSTGDSPDGMEATVRANGNGLFLSFLSAIPVGESPTGAGESPALPIFQNTLLDGPGTMNRPDKSMLQM